MNKIKAERFVTVPFKKLTCIKPFIVPESGHFLYSTDAKNSITKELEELIQMVEKRLA